MSFDFEKLLATLPEPQPLTSPLAIYGAGNMGREMGRYLLARNYKITAFIDRKAQPGDQFEGIPILTLAAWTAAHDSHTHTLILGVNNWYVNIAALTQELAPYGFLRMENAVNFVNIFPDFVKITPYEQESIYWLAPRAVYQAKLPAMNTLLSILADDVSVDVIGRIFTCRITGDFSVLSTPTPGDEYDPDDLPSWREPMRLIDCGAFDGDTYEFFEKRGYAIQAVANFEPDPSNYAQLVTKKRAGESINFPCGVADENKTLRFRRGLGVASYIDPTGDEVVQCVRIDDAIPDFAPTVLKMDIEGAEIPAILGAEQTIRTYRPDLILCLYHTPEHPWQIPLLIHSWGLGYRFYIRVHAESTCSIVLYAYSDRTTAG